MAEQQGAAVWPQEPHFAVGISERLIAMLRKGQHSGRPVAFTNLSNRGKAEADSSAVLQ